jgi:hypothetical protein
VRHRQAIVKPETQCDASLRAVVDPGLNAVPAVDHGAGRIDYRKFMGTDFLSNGRIGSGSCRSDLSDTNRSADKQDQNTVLKLDAFESRFQLSDVVHQGDVLLPSVAKG